MSREDKRIVELFRTGSGQGTQGAKGSSGDGVGVGWQGIILGRWSEVSR